MTAGKDEPKSIICNGTHRFRLRCVVLRRRNMGLCAEQVPLASLAAQAIDGPHARRGRDPAARVGRQPVDWPLAQRDRECFLHRVLGDVDIAEEANERRNRATGVFAEGPTDSGLVDWRQAQPPATPANGQTSIGRPIASLTLAANASAASRSAAFTT